MYRLESILNTRYTTANSHLVLHGHIHPRRLPTPLRIWHGRLLSHALARRRSCAPLLA